MLDCSVEAGIGQRVKADLQHLTVTIRDHVRVRAKQVRASTIIEGPLITFGEGCRIAWCPDVSTGGLFSVRLLSTSAGRVLVAYKGASIDYQR